MALQAIKLKGRIGPDGHLEILDEPAGLPEGEVEVIVLYSTAQPGEEVARLSPLAWPVLHGRRYLGGRLRREEIYDDTGR